MLEIKFVYILYALRSTNYLYPRYRLSYKNPEPQLNNFRLTSAPTEGLWPRQNDCEEQINNRLTVQKASFREWRNADRTLPVVICDHELVGGTQDRMQKLTSQRHDFVVKHLPKSERQRATGPPETIGTYCGSGTCTVPSQTTTGEAFRNPWTDGRRPLARPCTAVWSQGPNLRMAEVTETSSSYKQWSPPALYRSRPLPAYCRSEEPVNDRTVYTVSYRPPGSFRDPLPGEQPPADGYRYGDKSADEVLQPFYPRAHDYNL